MEIDTQRFIDYIRQVFTYKDGNLIRNQKISGGYDKSSGYYKVKIKGKSYLLHRIIFMYHYGYVPVYIDHIDKNKLNNKIENLRECKKKCFNAVNSFVRSDSSSNFKGVAWHKSSKKWQSSVFKDGKRHYLGLFIDPVEAAKAYNKKAQELFGEFAHLNKIPKEFN